MLKFFDPQTIIVILAFAGGFTSILAITLPFLQRDQRAARLKVVARRREELSQQQRELMVEERARRRPQSQAHVNLTKALLSKFNLENLTSSHELNRHSPDDIQIRGRRTTDPPPWELRTLRSPPMRRLWRADQVRNAIWQSIPPSRRTSPIVFTSPLISSAYAGTGLGRRSSIKLKIFWNKLLGTATSANWNVTYRP